MSYADIHCHLLPGVDDGARSLDEALGYARRLVSEGVGEAVATPHIGHPVFGANPEELPERVASLIPGIYDWPDTMPRPWPPDWTLPRKNFMSHFPEPDHWADRNIVGISFYRWLAIVNRGRNPGDNRYFYGE